MRKLVAIIVTVGVLVSFIGSCGVATGLGMHGIAELQAKHYQAGDAIDRSFPLVVLTPHPQTQKLDQLNLVFWRNLQAFQKEHPLHSFRLQSESGAFNVLDEIRASFHADNPGSALQTVEVRAAQSDPVFTGRYQATDTTVTPLYFKMVHVGLMIQAVPIGLGVACLLYFVAWRLANKRLRTLDPSAGTQRLPLITAITTLLFSKTRQRER